MFFICALRVGVALSDLGVVIGQNPCIIADTLKDWCERGFLRDLYGSPIALAIHSLDCSVLWSKLKFILFWGGGCN